MSIEVLQDNLCINRLIERKKKEIELETAVIVPDVKPDIIKPIDLSGTICIYKKELINGRVKIDGSIDSNIIYLADSEDESIRGLNSNIDFSEFIEIDNEIINADIDVNIEIKDMECNILNGRKINLKAIIEINLRIYSNDGINILKDIKGVSGLQKLDKVMQLNSMTGKNSTKSIAKENIILAPEEKIVEILKKEIRIINKDFKLSYNKIVAKAEVDIKILYLNSEGKIKFVEKILPIAGFIDMENVTEENICDVKYCVKNILVKLNNENENSFYVEIEVEINCFVYETKDIEIIQDVYTPLSTLTYKDKTITAMVGLQNINDEYQINEQIMDPEICDSNIYNTSITTNINNIRIVENRAICEGEAIVSFLYGNLDNNNINKKDFRFPINYEVNILEGMQEDSLDILIDVDGYEIKKETTNIKLNINLKINIKMFKTVKIDIIDDIEEKEIEKKEEYSIIIYFVKEGDTLWKIAKRFGSTIEDIKKVNNIENVDEIKKNEQLFIPRYIEKNKEYKIYG